MRQRILLSWSSGKDSAWALQALRCNPSVEVSGLLTTVNERWNRVAMHGVRQDLVEAQAAAVGVPLHVVTIPHPCSNAVYEARHVAELRQAAANGIDGIAFGDVFLADVRAYRQRLTAAAGLAALFPLWGLDTARLARRMLDDGLRARLTCVDPRCCPRDFVGRDLHEVLPLLPPAVDPCGENGEFHTFAYAGPMFARALAIELGVVVQREGFVFADLTLARDLVS